MLKTGVLNIIFRGITLLSKFIFILFLGKYALNEAVLGSFGIITTTISLLIYLIGFDFYVFNTREIVQNPEKTDIVHNIKNQFFFHVALYVLLLPIVLFLCYYFDFIAYEYIFIIPLLFISEHLGQEFFRLFTALQKSVLANILFFIKSGLWVFVVLIDYFILNNAIDLKRYLLIWMCFSWISVLISCWFLKKELRITSLTYSNPNIQWIVNGVKKSSVFFLSSFSFIIIQFSDRFMIDYFCGKDLVGVYTAYAQFTNAIEVFIFSAVIMILYPKLLETVKDKVVYKAIYKKFSIQILIGTLVLIAGSIIITPYIFSFLEKPLFLQKMTTYYMLLAGIFLLLASYIYHYHLYAFKKDNLLLRISFIAMLLNVVLNLFLIPKYDIFGASIATAVAFAVLLLLKFLYSRKITHDSI